MFGSDFNQAFTPVIKPTILCIVLSIATANYCRIRRLYKLHFYMIFLKIVLIEQPPGFVNPNFSNHACHLSVPYTV